MNLQLKIRPCTLALMEELEEKNCLRRIRSPQSAASAASPGTIVDAPVYIGSPEYGPHMLLCVGVNQQVPMLTTHPEPEDILLINDGRQTRPLIFLISRLSASELENRAASGTLNASDLIAMEAVFNDPNLSFFTMLPGTPHGEMVMEENGEPPYFFVAESRDLPCQEMNLSGTDMVVSR